jgi:hypothetical protein
LIRCSKNPRREIRAQAKTHAAADHTRPEEFQDETRPPFTGRLPVDDTAKLDFFSSTIGSTMIVEYSDAHQGLVDMVGEAEAKEPGIGKYVLIEVVSAVRHLCDQYGLNYEEVIAEAAELYRHQQERDLKNLEARE